MNGISEAERAAREAKIEERRRRIILDMKMDEELLPEGRWPYKSPRAKVRPTPPPAFDVDPDIKVHVTKSHTERVRATLRAKQQGAFDTKEEREKKMEEERRRQAQKRAAIWTKLQQGMLQSKLPLGGGGASAGGGGGGTYGLASDLQQHQQGPAPGGDGVGLAAELGLASPASPAPGPGDDAGHTPGKGDYRQQLAGRSDNPPAYIDARHKQIEAQVRAQVESVLLNTGGLEALKYVEQ